jgi:hypothetical protein
MPNEKAIYNIENLLSIRLRKLEINKELALNPFTISLQYFEAYFLEKKIMKELDHFSNDYECSVLRNILMSLNKQLI